MSILKDGVEGVKNLQAKDIEIIEPVNCWMWLSIIELIIIIFLILVLFARKKNNEISKIKKESLEQPVDFGHIIDSGFNANKLYDELKKKCHPDRFVTDKEKNIIAEKLFQEISENKSNIKRLKELKLEAIEKLNINF